MQTIVPKSDDRLYVPNNPYIWSTQLIISEDEEIIPDKDTGWKIIIERNHAQRIVIDNSNDNFRIENLSSAENGEYIGIEINISLSQKDTAKLNKNGPVKILVKNGVGMDENLYFWHYLIPDNSVNFYENC